MKLLSAVIAEDEQNLRDELRESLAAVWPELVIAAECEDGDQALAALKRHAPDVMFLDIQMPGLTGLEVAKQASGRCHVVFVTAYDKYAVAAFEAGAIDYVMKPFSSQRLEETARRLKARVAQPPANLGRFGINFRFLLLKAEQSSFQYRFVNSSVSSHRSMIVSDYSYKLKLPLVLYSLTRGICCPPDHVRAGWDAQ